MTLAGLDASRFNGKVPWSTIRPAFAFIRLTSGIDLDPKAGAHLAGAAAADVELLAGYAWLRGDQAGADQAAAYLARARQLEAMHGRLAHAVDVEHRNAPGAPWPLPAYRTAVLAFLGAMRDAARVCAVYGPRDLLAELQLPAWVGALPFWAASSPPAPAPWSTIAIQQTGVVDDLDRNTFPGSREDWRRMFGLSKAAGAGREACLERALAELGVHEDGTNTGERVREYLAGCVRDGRKLGLKAGEWCAAFVGWCGHRPWRASVWEIVEDARAAGTLREVGAYWPSPGDLAVFARGAPGETPLEHGRGHIARVIRAAGRDVETVDGNSGDAADSVARMVRRVADVVCWVAVESG